MTIYSIIKKMMVNTLNLNIIILFTILPLVLFNGAEGIGTGWSTNIPQFNPRIICEYIIKKL
jgi:DNA gyrase/topoisomerase IV subunit A